jgi:hypothetical protein
MAVTDEVEEQVEPKDEIVRKLAVGEPEQKGTRFTASNILRLLLLIAILAFLGIYVGPGDMISTLLKVVVVVVASAALFVAANLLFDLAYDRWTLFNVIVGAISGFVGYFVLSANGIFRSLIDNRVNLAGQGPYDVNDWLWALIGGGAVALIMFLLSAPRQQLARLPLSTIGPADHRLGPALDLRGRGRRPPGPHQPGSAQDRGRPAVGPERCRCGLADRRLGRR